MKSWGRTPITIFVANLLSHTTGIGCGVTFINGVPSETLSYPRRRMLLGECLALLGCSTEIGLYGQSRSSMAPPCRAGSFKSTLSTSRGKISNLSLQKINMAEAWNLRSACNQPNTKVEDGRMW